MAYSAEKSTKICTDDGEQRLSAEEGWQALQELVGSMTGWYDEYGGPEEWLRKHRSGED